jgi:cytochrome c oxidase assembly factor CtaG
MRNLRYGDWICGLGAAALLVLLLVDDAHDVGSQGWLALILAVLALAAGLAAPVLDATRQSPSGPLLALVCSLVVGFLAAVALLVEGAWLECLAAVAVSAGGFLRMKDESAPAAVDKPIERRPAPPATS